MGVTSLQARREQQQHNLYAIMLFSFGIPEAVMSNLRVHPQFESRYNDLGDLSTPDGWPRRVHVYEGSFNRTNPEPNLPQEQLVLGRAQCQYIHHNTLQGTPYMMHRRYDYCRY